MKLVLDKYVLLASTIPILSRLSDSAHQLLECEFLNVNTNTCMFFSQKQPFLSFVSTCYLVTNLSEKHFYLKNLPMTKLYKSLSVTLGLTISLSLNSLWRQT